MNTTASTSSSAGSTATETVDLLIVGGGPAGTAAAFRAKELGLKSLVIDFDDILKRIRDYPKDKPILPDFGGGDMGFPAGGDCIRALEFDPIDKDELCDRWKGYYRSFDIPVRIGLELVSCERVGDTWKVVVYDHKKSERDEIHARSIVLGLGRGVPRRFDIPGNLDGVAYRMDDPANYLAGPVIVVGGGTSAAEAVIAIANAKIAAEEPCAVYWSYRGTKMPRVSKALADQFFEAYVGNGNIRYLPESEPVAVVTAPDKSDLVSFRIDRKTPSSRPSETVHLEFAKPSCIACIGADIPEPLLRDLGIPMVPSGPKNKKTIVASPLLESCQDDVYLIGDLLSQTYLEADDFNAPVENFRPVKHRGNIRSSLRDGVFVAEVIKQRLDGRSRTEVDVVIDLVQSNGAGRDPRITTMVGLTGDASTESPADEPTDESPASLVLVTQAGVEAEEFPLKSEGATTLGRADSDINFPQDTGLTDSHASISVKPEGFFLRDDGSRTGTYIRIGSERPVSVKNGDLIRLGRQILVVDGEAGPDRVIHYDAAGRNVGSHSIEGTTVFGRSGGPSAPDVLLDNEDMTLSRFHMSLAQEDGVLQLLDFNSRNGTFLKVDSERKLEHGDVIRMGGQELEFHAGVEAPQKTGSQPVPARKEPESAAVGTEPAPAVEPPAVEPAATPAGPHVTFADQDISGGIDAADTLLEWADENDVAIDFECFAGLCGCDVIRVVEGAENLSEVHEKEIKTLKRKGLEAGEYRLACMTRASGPVVVEVVD